MSRSVEQVISTAFLEFQRLHAAGDSFSAFVSLGEIYNYLSQLDRHGPEVLKWRDTVSRLTFSDQSLSEALVAGRKQAERLRRILDVGTSFEYEELMLVIALRTELDMFCQFLRERGIVPDFDATLADEEIHAVATSRQHSGSFLNAQRAAKRNWKVPIASRWLEETQRGGHQLN